MGKADSLRLRDVRDAYRLIGECRDLGADPVLWYPHMLDGLRRLLGGLHATGGEGWWWQRPGGIRAVSAFDSTDDEAAHSAFVAYQEARGQADDPFYHAAARVPGRLMTYRRRDLVSDDVWFRSPSYQMYRRPYGVEHEMTSVLLRSEDGAMCAIAINRMIGDPDFSPRELRLLRFLHAELGRLVGRALASAIEQTPDTLPPRLRQTLACLLEGDSEKQVAARLGLSRATVHQYVTMLYRRFRVRSRAQLLAHVAKRRANERWRGRVPA